jgi:hypothetical protein
MIPVCAINIEVRKLRTQIVRHIGCFNRELVFDDVEVCEIYGRRYIVDKKKTHQEHYNFDYYAILPQDIAMKISTAAKLGEI